MLYERTPLKTNCTITPSGDIAGLGYTPSFTIIGEPLGFGGSSIVYKVREVEQVNTSSGVIAQDRYKIIKEFYPSQLAAQITRRDDGLLCVADGNEERFKSLCLHFLEGYAKHIAFQEDAPNQTVSAIFHFEANGTVYTVMEQGDGATLDKLPQVASVYSAAELMLDLCRAILPYHEHKPMPLLHLDIKPHNIYKLTGEDRVKLFDFDTVQSIDNIQNGTAVLSFSEDWAAKEQRDGNYKKVNAATDIYSIGSVLFWLLMGRRPTPEEITMGINWDIRKKSKLCSGLNDIAVETLMRVFKNTLTNTPQRRYQSVRQLMPELEELREVTRPGYRELQHRIQTVGTAVTEGQARIAEELHSTTAATNQELKSHKKLIVAIICFVAVIAIGVGVLAFRGKQTSDLIKNSGLTELDSASASHLLLDLQNANHQYEMGLNNWKRLDYPRAERDISAALEEVSAQKSQSTIEVAKISNSLGCLYLDIGKYELANDCLNSAYVTFRDELGPDSLESRAAQSALAKYDYYVGNHEQALRELQEIKENSDEEREKSVVSNLTHFQAMIYCELGEYSQALSAYDEVLALYADVLQDDKLSEELAEYTTDSGVDEYTRNYYRTCVKWIIWTYNCKGYANLALGNVEPAIEDLLIALEISLDNLYIGERNLNTAAIYQNLAEAELQRGNIEEATEHIEKAIAIQRALFEYTDDYPGLTGSWLVYGDILVQDGESVEAAEYYEKALAQAERKYGRYHLQTAAASIAFAEFLIDNGETTRAAELLEQALDIRTSTLSLDHPDTIQLYIDLAIVCVQTGDMSSAEEYISKAEKLSDELFPESNLLKMTYDGAIKEIRQSMK